MLCFGINSNLIDDSILLIDKKNDQTIIVRVYQKPGKTGLGLAIDAPRNIEIRRESQMTKP